MGSTEGRPEASAALAEIRLSVADIPGCVALSAEARWNQTADDWQMMLGLGEGFGLMNPAGTLVATSLALAFPSGGFGWISMVLVTESQRRRGLATRLMACAMAALEARKLVSILDATPAGREVYRLLGFRDTWGIERMQCLEAPKLPAIPKVKVRRMTDTDWPAVCAMDARAFCADRRELIGALRDGETGIVEVKVCKSPEQHWGTLQNGITSSPWHSYTASYTVQKFRGNIAGKKE